MFSKKSYSSVAFIYPHQTLEYSLLLTNFWEEIEKGIELHATSGKVYITGDMNGRTSDFSDILDFDEYLENNDLFTDISHIPMRVNQDHFVDSQGRKLLDLCKSSVFMIANCRIGDDRGIGQVTFLSAQGVSTVDYLLLQNSDINSINSFKILPPNEFSDHAPLYFSFLPIDLDEDVDVDIDISQNKIFWDNEKVPLFRQYIEQSLPNLLSSNDTNCTINEKVELLRTFLAENSTKVFGKVVYRKNNDTKNGKIKTSQWFDAECKTAKKRIYKSSKLLCET